MKLIIEKRGYSRSPWRLVNADTGDEIVHPDRFEHPTLGVTEISEPVCGRTKDEVVQKALGLLAYAAERLRNKEPSAEPRPCAVPVKPGFGPSACKAGCEDEYSDRMRRKYGGEW